MEVCFCICENKGAEELCGNRLCFHCIDSTICLLPKFEIQASSHLLWLAVQPGFVPKLVGNPKDRLSLDVAHLIMCFRISS